MDMRTIVRSSVYLVITTIIFGLCYTLGASAISRTLFPKEADGSIIEVGGKRYSPLLGQQFKAMNHLWGRPMNIDTETFRDKNGNKAMYAWPSNLSPAGDKFSQLTAVRTAELKKAHPEMLGESVPAELVTVSGSGLDPHISPAAAEYQVGRIAAHSGRGEDEVRNIIEENTEGRLLGIFGEPRVNVLLVNLALDGAAISR